MPRSRAAPGAKRKIIEFDAETWQALHSLALDRMNTIQELVEDAVADLLKKHHRPVTLKEALTASTGEQSESRHRIRKPGDRAHARRAA
jgi:hypothetical protein